MSIAKKLTLRVVREDVGDQETYAVMCLEHDLVSQGPTIGLAIERFGEQWGIYQADDVLQPPETIDPPPDEVIEIFFGDISK